MVLSKVEATTRLRWTEHKLV